MTKTGPRTLLEAVRHFSNLDVCHEYMRGVKWPDGNIVCPKITPLGGVTTGKLKYNWV